MTLSLREARIRKKQPYRPLLVNLALLVFVCVLAVGAAEGVLRITKSVNRLHNRATNIFDPDIGYYHGPKQSTIFRFEGQRIPYGTNNLGFRDRDREVPKPADTYRVLFLGDSFLESPWLPSEAIFPAVLEERFREREVASGKKVEFLNFGVLGYGTGVQYNQLLKIGVQTEPDFVAVAFFINDILDNYTTPLLPGGRPDPEFLDPIDYHLAHYAKDSTGGWRFIPAEPYPHRGAVRTFLNKEFHLYQFLGDSFPALKKVLRLFERKAPEEHVTETSERRLEPNQMFNFLQSPPVEVVIGWEATEYILGEMKSYLSLKGIPMMLTFLPPDYLLSREAWEAEMKARGLNPDEGAIDLPEQKVKAICEKLDIEFVSPTAKFRASGKQLHFKSDPHFNASGHALMADVMETYFQNRLAPGRK
ncbi:MAG: SGNH/GDSL hydrolase family protein [Candidatus Omnitrophota bacterium]|nr:SGNH/GDSL hydrolase family protein [Candidatus Omnitrophota bacterium]